MEKKTYRNVVFDLGGVLIQWDPENFIRGMFPEREQPPLELARATSLPCWKLLDKGDITREQSVDLLPAPFSKGTVYIIYFIIIKIMY